MTTYPRDFQKENTVLRHRLDTLLAEMERRDDPLPCRLTPSQEIIARLLRSHSPRFVTREALFQALYAFRVEVDEPDARTVDVLLSKTRTQLRSIGITVLNEYGRGWRIDIAGANRWDELAKGKR